MFQSDLSIHCFRPFSTTPWGVMNEWILAPFKFTAAVLAADFVVGVIHWIEDAYIREDWPVLGHWVGRPNVLHHYQPRFFTRKSWFASCWDQNLGALLFLGLAWALGVLSWPLVLFAVLVGNANEIHKWAHRSRKENGRLVSFLHDIRLLQGARHHAIHHTDPKSTHYCVITEFLNPILEHLRFWTRIECTLWRLFHIRRRIDTSNRRHAFTPDWIRSMPRGRESLTVGREQLQSARG
jgi:ubiquitin-conjugating enzyme E2 variant